MLPRNPLLSFSWFLYEVIDETKSKQGIDQNSDELLLVEGLENFAATGKTQNKCLTTFFKTLSQVLKCCRFST